MILVGLQLFGVGGCGNGRFSKCCEDNQKTQELTNKAQYTNLRSHTTLDRDMDSVKISSGPVAGISTMQRTMQPGQYKA